MLFELGARPHPPRELYRAYLAQSDIFIGLYWQRYGWVGPGMDISGLEDEFRLSHSIPRLLYVKKPAPDREPGLTAMIDELQTEGTDSYRTFRTPRELGRLVRDDLALLLSERFAAADSRADRSASPASNGDRRGPRSLPVTSTTLIGREQDIVEVSKLLAKPEVRLVTLTGPGGIGKTRLAIAVGEQLDDRYPRGTVFVPLASIAQPELVLPRIARRGGRDHRGRAPALGRPGRAVRGHADPARAGQPRTGRWRRARARPAAGPLPSVSRSSPRAAPCFGFGPSGSTRSAR